MRKNKLFAGAALWLLACSTLLGAQDKLTLDLKTPLMEKAKLSPVKLGASWYLLKDGFKILDAGEDYALWLSGYSQKKSGSWFEVELTVELTPTSAFTKPAVLASRKVSYRFSLEAPREMDVDQAATVFLRERLERKTDIALEEGRVGGLAVARAVRDLLSGRTGEY